MQNGFHELVIGFLKKETGFQIEEIRKFDTPFDTISIPEKNLVLHCISVSKNLLQNIPPGFFSGICDQAGNQQVKITNLWEDVWTGQNELVKLRLLSQLGVSKRAHARLTEFIRLDKNKANTFLNANHLQHGANAYFKFGLEYKTRLMAAATFSKSRLMNYETNNYRSHELVRFASCAGYTVTGGLSKLISGFINECNAEHIMTYADRDWSEGASYKKLGFKKIENTPPQMFWIHPKEMIRYYQNHLPENLLIEFSRQHKLQIDEWLIQKGYMKIYNAGNLKFVLDLRINP